MTHFFYKVLMISLTIVTISNGMHVPLYSGSVFRLSNKPLFMPAKRFISQEKIKNIVSLVEHQDDQFNLNDFLLLRLQYYARIANAEKNSSGNYLSMESDALAMDFWAKVLGARAILKRREQEKASVSDNRLASSISDDAIVIRSPLNIVAVEKEPIAIAIKAVSEAIRVDYLEKIEARSYIFYIIHKLYESFNPNWPLSTVMRHMDPYYQLPLQNSLLLQPKDYLRTAQEVVEEVREGVEKAMKARGALFH